MRNPVPPSSLHGGRTSRRRRRTSTVAAAGAAAMLLAACGTSSTPSSSSKPSSPSSAKALTSLPKGTVNLTMWVLASNVEKQTAEAQVKAFEAIHPNIHIKVVESSGAGNVQAQLSDAVAHTLPDLLWSADVLTTDEADHGILVNLSPYMKAYGYSQSQFVRPMMALGQYKGNQYVVPRGVDQVVLAYNPKIFALMHVPVPKMGITWSQFAKLGPELTKKVNGVQYYALGQSGVTGFNVNGYPIQEAAVRWYGGHFTSANGDSCTMDSSKAEKGISKVIAFAEKYSDLNVHLPSPGWEAGHVAMEWMVRPQLDSDLNASSTAWKLPFTPRVVNFPLMEPSIEIPAGMSGYAETVDTPAADRNAASAYMMFLLSKKGELARSKVAGSVPIRTDLAKSPVWRAFPPTHPPLVDQSAFIDYSNHEALPPKHLTIDTGPAYTAITNAFTAVELHKGSVSSEMKKACSSIDSAIASGSA